MSHLSMNGSPNTFIWKREFRQEKEEEEEEEEAAAAAAAGGV